MPIVKVKPTSPGRRAVVKVVHKLGEEGRIAVRHARLRRIPNADKRIVLMLSAYPTKHARIGNAVGLDTPASVIKLLEAMRQSGTIGAPLDAAIADHPVWLRRVDGQRQRGGGKGADPFGQALIRKTSFASRSNRRRGGAHAVGRQPSRAAFRRGAASAG